ncbi:c-type cytochrome [Pseudomonas carassii]|uniref:C-type cytochrome n=1 Tax=Pseudomonas carassii TaxID=3115855 RepID=A0ABU7H626_9PSED|nr:c-type cytochrome [Pseudomonas sp. 137P]MEE1886487.1 c-type cytochrome [Pseudomonas sp. 137P]
MKKKLLLLFSLLIVTGLGFYGRELVGLYQLVSYVDSVTEAHDANGPWPQVFDGCNGCHGANGSSLHQRYPSLAGQPAAYVTAQLHSFANGQRVYPNMQPMAQILSADEITFLADYYARQPVVANHGVKPDPALHARGEQLAKGGACTACHGAQLMGQGNFPRLAGQGVDYLQAQLDAFAEGRRVDPSGAMTAIVANLTTQDRQALSHYLATLAPPAK